MHYPQARRTLAPRTMPVRRRLPCRPATLLTAATAIACALAATLLAPTAASRTPARLHTATDAQAASGANPSLSAARHSPGSVTSAITDPSRLVSPRRTAAGGPLDARALSRIPWIEDPSWSPDGRHVAYTSDANGSRNVWIVDVDSLKPRAIAPAQQDQSSPQWSPDGKHITFTADRAGDEIYDVFIAEIATGRTTNVTASPGHVERFAAWSPNGREIAYSMRDKSSGFAEIAVMDIDTRKVRVLARTTVDGRSLAAPHWSPQGDWIYYHDFKWSGGDSTILRVRPDGTNRAEMTPHSASAEYALAGISPDGQTLLVRSTANNGWQNIATVNVSSRAVEWITNEPSTFFAGGFSRDGRSIAFTRNVGADTHVFLYDRQQKSTRPLAQGNALRELAVPELPLRQRPSPFSPDGTALLYMREAATAPTEILTARIADGTETTLVSNPIPDAARASLVEAVEVEFPSTDGKFQLHATVWMPSNLTRDRSHPVVVDIHGGPAMQSRAYFRRLAQTLVSNGYIVISPNYRGSTGYDQTFYRANYRDMGGGDLADVNATADWIARSDFVDPRRIAAMGASYGGYLTLMAVSKTPRKWAAGVALVPFADWVTQYENETPPLQAYDREMMGTPEQNAALLRDRSPLHFADRIRAPLLMTAGANDPRCPPEQARQMERAIRANGGVVDLTIYDEQGHLAANTANYEDESVRVLRFLNGHVRDARQSVK